MKDPDKKNLGIRYAKRICDSCGKTWMLRIDTDGWAYKLPDKNHYAYFCSWTCLREFEKEKEKKQRLKRNNWYIK